MKVLSLITPSKPEFDNTVNEILRRAEYDHLGNSLKNFIDTVKTEISDWIIRILEKSFSNKASVPKISDNLSTIFMIVGILTIMAIIILIALKMSKTFEKRGRIKEILGEKIDDRTTPISLKNRAESFRAKGDFRQAVRYDFIALLLLMHEKSLIYLDETKTNEEIYQYLKKEKFLLLNDFKRLSDMFNLAWYGHKEMERGTYDTWSDARDSSWNGVINYEEKNQ